MLLEGILFALLSPISELVARSSEIAAEKRLKQSRARAAERVMALSKRCDDFERNFVVSNPNFEQKIRDDQCMLFRRCMPKLFEGYDYCDFYHLLSSSYIGVRNLNKFLNICAVLETGKVPRECFKYGMYRNLFVGEDRDIEASRRFHYLMECLNSEMEKKGLPPLRWYKCYELCRPRPTFHPLSEEPVGRGIIYMWEDIVYYPRTTSMYDI